MTRPLLLLLLLLSLVPGGSVAGESMTSFHHEVMADRKSVV